MSEDPSNITITLPLNSILLTCIAPVNIAVIKYWGKRDEKLILPINSSLSGTINSNTMCSNTTIIASKEYGNDSMTLNGSEEDINSNNRLKEVISYIKNHSNDYYNDQNKILVKKEDWKLYKLKIISFNNFPTAAGLASSASGFACLTYCLCKLYNANVDMSMVARLGSGSACRSIYGGFVKWNMGIEKSGHDSVASQVCDENYWPDMRVVILVANSSKKTVSSTSGMKTSVETSAYLQQRPAIVEKRMKIMEQAILNRDFNSFAVETMRDSNSFHACCLDTYPPIFYMNETSKKVVRLVEAFNKNGIKAAYTFDAGPNAVIYLLDKDLSNFVAAVNFAFTNSSSNVSDKLNLLTPCFELDKIKSELALFEDIDDGISQVIVSNIGAGPNIIKFEHSF